MPSGQTHAKATVALAIGGGLLAYFSLDQTLIHSVALSGGALVGVVLTPDLDVNNGSISQRIVRRSGGDVLGLLWILLWWPYGQLIPHRSPLSHFPVLGTVLRLAYLLFLPTVLFWALGGNFATLAFPQWVLWMVGGLTLADTLHFIMDNVFHR